MDYKQQLKQAMPTHNQVLGLQDYSGQQLYNVFEKAVLETFGQEFVTWSKPEESALLKQAFAHGLAEQPLYSDTETSIQQLLEAVHVIKRNFVKHQEVQSDASPTHLAAYFKICEALRFMALQCTYLHMDKSCYRNVIKELSASKQQLETHKAVLSKDRQQACREVQHFRNLLAEAEQRMKAAEEQLRARDMEHAAKLACMQQQVEQLVQQQTKQAVESALSAVQKEREADEAIWYQLNAELNLEKQHLQAVVKLVKGMWRLQSQCALAEKLSREAAEAEVQQARRLMQDLVDEIEQQDKEILLVKENVRQLQHELEVQMNNKGAMQKELQGHQTDKAALQHEVKLHISSNAALHKELQAHKIDSTALKQELRAEKNDKAALQRQLEIQKAATEKLQVELQKAYACRQAVEEELAVVKDAANQTQAEMRSLKLEMRKLKQQQVLSRSSSVASSPITPITTSSSRSSLDITTPVWIPGTPSRTSLLRARTCSTASVASQDSVIVLGDGEIAEADEESATSPEPVIMLGPVDDTTAIVSSGAVIVLGPPSEDADERTESVAPQHAVVMLGQAEATDSVSSQPAVNLLGPAAEEAQEAAAPQTSGDTTGPAALAAIMLPGASRSKAEINTSSPTLDIAQHQEIEAAPAKDKAQHQPPVAKPAAPAQAAAPITMASSSAAHNQLGAVASAAHAKLDRQDHEGDVDRQLSLVVFDAMAAFKSQLSGLTASSLAANNSQGIRNTVNQLVAPLAKKMLLLDVVAGESYEQALQRCNMLEGLLLEARADAAKSDPFETVFMTAMLSEVQQAKDAYLARRIKDWGDKFSKGYPLYVHLCSKMQSLAAGKGMSEEDGWAKCVDELAWQLLELLHADETDVRRSKRCTNLIYLLRNGRGSMVAGGPEDQRAIIGTRVDALVSSVGEIKIRFQPKQEESAEDIQFREQAARDAEAAYAASQAASSRAEILKQKRLRAQSRGPAKNFFHWLNKRVNG